MLESPAGFLGGGDIAISDNRNTDAGIALYLANERPVGLAGVHLTAGAAVDGKRLDAAVLQLFGQCGDDELFLVPSQPGLHGDGRVDGLHHLAGDFQKQFGFLQHPRSCPFAGHFLYRTAEVQVYHIRVGFGFHDTGSLNHLRHVAPVNLNAHGPFLIGNGQFVDS